MTHTCVCGRTMHWPHDAKIGDVWTCRNRNCLRSHTLSREGTPPKMKASTKKAAERNPDLRRAPSGGSCFPADTVIQTPNGALAIASMKEGDIVYALDPHQAVLHRRRILKIRRGVCKIWEIELFGGRRLRTTATHSIRVAGTWKQARRITAGDMVLALDSNGKPESCRVVSSRMTADVENVFNLIIERDFSFIADDVVVHCFSRFRRLRILCWRLYSGLREEVYGKACEEGSARGFNASKMISEQ